MIEWTNRDAVLTAMSRWPRIFAEESQFALSAYAEVIVAEIIERTPVGHGGGPWGHLANSIQAGDPYKTGRGWEIEYGTPAEYAEPIEYGRRPGSMPPVAAIAEWVLSKPSFGVSDEKEALRIAYPIARAIARRGYKDHPDGWKMFEEGLKAAEPRLEMILNRMRTNIDRRTSLGQ